MTELFRTVLSMSIGAGVLGLMVLFARAIIGRRQTIALTLMFALLIARLTVPVNIESQISIQNLIPINIAQVESESNTNHIKADNSYVPSLISEREGIAADSELVQHDSEVNETIADEPKIEETAAKSQSAVVTNVANQPLKIDFWQIAAYLWAAGVAILALIIFISNTVFMRKVRRNRDYVSLELDKLIEQCAAEFRIKQKIRAVRMSEINNVAVCGIFKPILLISSEAFEKLTEQEKSNVIMHEMSHIKRKDTLLSLILTVVSVIHWFNPIVWFAFAAFRKDIEVMCDSKVLARMKSRQRKSYAQTLLKLAKNVNGRNPKLAMALFMSKASIKRRITMIAKYKRNKPILVVLALVLAIGIAITGCTTSINGDSLSESIEAEELELLASYTMDFSDYADDKTRMHNIKKAADKMNGVHIEPYKQIAFLDIMGPITAEKGWQTAPGFTMESVIQMAGVSDWDNALVIDTDPQIEQIGGGIGLIEAALIRIVRDAKLRTGIGGNFEGLITEAEADFENWFDSDVVFETVVEGNTVNVYFYGKSYSPEQMEQMRVAQGIREEIQAAKEEGIELISTFTLDYSEYAYDEARVYNIKKAARLLNGVTIEPDEQVDILNTIGPITSTYGWQKAPGITWKTILQLVDSHDVNNELALSANPSFEQVGGGVDLVVAAFCIVGIDAGVDYGLSWSSGYIYDGDAGLANWFDTKVVFETIQEENTIIINLYGPGNFDEQHQRLNDEKNRI